MKKTITALCELFLMIALSLPFLCHAAAEGNDAPDLSHLRYDDHVTLAGMEVEIIDAGIPTSYQVGYGIEKNTVFDTAVVTLDGDTLIATGIGKATILVDGKTYEVQVSPAPISLLLLIGQSNMRGSEGNADQSIVCPDGMVYSSHGDDRGTANPVMTLSNARSFAASALAGAYCSINVEGTADCISGYPLHNLTDAGTGKIGLDSGLGFEWVKQTGEKVWMVNAAVGGTAIASWQPGASCYKKASALFSACQETLQAEISAGHYTLSHMGYFWCQGCSDNDGRSAEWYVDKFLTMHASLQKDLAFDHDGNAATKDVTFEFAGIIPVRAGHAHFIGYRDGTSQDTTTAKYYESFLDLRFTGPRVAQYWLANNPDLPDIWNVCTIGDDWVWMPDGTNGVTAYFQEHYEGGTVDYTTQVRQSASWYTPTTPKAVHDSIHYNQIGYNELGREAARNTLIILGEIEAPNVDTTINLLGWDGYTEIDDITAAATGASGTLVVPVISPVWKSKAFTYTLSEGLEWNYYDLLATDMQKDGTLSIGGRTVTVHQDVYHTYLAQLPETICRGLNLWNELEHDTQYFADGTGWSVHSSGTVYSVTIPVKPGDILYTTSFCAAGANGNSSTDGIFITYFDEYDVVKSLAPSEVYSEFIANEGYLVVPDGVVAVNIPMWSNSDNNKLFLLNHDHRSADSVKTTAPTCTESGVTTHTCGICSNSYHESVPATGHAEASIPAVAPSCTVTGLTEGVRCSICGEVLAVPSEVAATGHSYDDGVITTTPACTAGGIKTFTCEVCGDSYTETISATGHMEEAIPAVAPTCTKPGLTAGVKCSVCGEILTAQAEVAVLGHTYDDGIETTAPTCTEDGIKTFTCTVCGNAYTEVIIATDHNYMPVVTDSTCTGVGYTTYTCSTCGDSYTSDETPAAGHAYDDGVETTAPTYTKEGVKTFTCTACGDTYIETIPALDYSDSNPYKGKVFSIMGDSISTFAGYIPTADGFNRTHLARYPQDNLLTDVYATWWMQAIVDLDAKLGINDSWRGATVSGAHPVTSGDTGENAAMSNLVRIQNLGSNGTPDVILFYGGTNDIAHVSKIGSFNPENAPATVDLTTMKWDNLADAYAHTLLRMKHYYPDAIILALLPTYTASYYSDARLAQANETLVDICEYYGVPYIDLRDCGITADDLPDGIHPGEHGMDLITAAVIDALLVIDIPAGENVVYGVKHNLSNATASRGYYKGISAGTSFEETLTGDNLSVTVTMGGKDITAECYSNGQISIEKVTGALEITAKSPFSLGNHLQEIPSDAYNNTNLWQVLKPEKGYFKGAEWVSNYSSVTIPVTAGDQLWATSFGASGENGGSMNGIRVTYFDAYGMLATIEPDAVYDEFQQNGYLTVPEGATAVCITMWTNTNAELYLLTLPDGPVLPGSHLQSIPPPVCSGVNLWQVLKPEKGYFKGATWVDYYSSVTFPVVAGDQLWATSFGASGDNGGTINGIRVTYFDAHGMLVSLEATEVYEEFQENGCVTVPENAVSVNVVMWNGDVSDELYILNLEHNYDDGVETLAPTCTADGVKTFTCEICGSTSTEAIPAAGHTEEVIPAVAPSCTDTGLTEGVQCSICGEVLAVPSEVAALGHSHIAVITAPTCTEKGITTHTCSTCGDSYVSDEVAATGHSYDDGVITTTPACTAGGIKTFTCEVCGDSYTETISAAGHMEEAIPAVAPTCTAPGLTAGMKCSVCGEILTAQAEVAVLGHTYDDGIETTAPTCTEDGIKTFTCTVCGNAYTEVIIATDHNYMPVVTDSTCTGVGYTTYTCSTCGDSYTSDETPASGHSYDAGVVTTAPTCTKEGVKTFTCSACGIYYTEPVPATGHAQKIIPAVPPTCTETGLTTGMKCSVCGEILTAQTEVPAFGHSYNSGVETTAPTCTAGGVKTFTCGGCGDSYTEVLPALGHAETTLPAVAPTCTTDGKTEGLHCNVCGTVFTPQDILPALGHTEGEPVITVEPTVQTAGIRSVFCDTCGELIRSESITVTGSLYIPGDADDNGRVDIYDALLVMQYSAGWDVTPNLLNADISKDGIVDLYDAVMILQSCAGTSFDSALRTLLEKAEELLIDVMTILEHPQDQHVIEGQQAVFRLSAAGAGLQYQWYIDRGNGDSCRPIAGATSDTYTISATQMNDDGCRYRCGITDASGRQIMSNPATLYVEPAVELPQTGDQSDLLLWTTLMAISLCCLVGLVVADKRYPIFK